MRRLILDTNILHQEGLASRNMQQLGRLADAGEVEVCVPTLVRREFLSKRTVDSFDALAGMQRSLRELNGRVEYSPEAKMNITAARASLAQVQAEIGMHVEATFRDWAARHRVRELPFDPAAIEVVIDNYFTGTGAFRKPKHRDDIIDSMIGCSVNALVNTADQIFVAVKDVAFKRYLLSIDGVCVVDSIEKFLLEPEVSAALARLNEADNWATHIQAQLQEPAFQEATRAHLISRSNDLLACVYLEGKHLAGTEELTVRPNWGARLNGIAAEPETRILFNAASYDSEQNFSLGIRITGKGEIDYAADYGDYNAAVGEYSDIVPLESMGSDGLCDIREVRRVTVTGYLRLSLAKKLRPEELVDAVEDGDIGLELDVDRGAIA